MAHVGFRSAESTNSRTASTRAESAELREPPSWTAATAYVMADVCHQLDETSLGETHGQLELMVVNRF